MQASSKIDLRLSQKELIALRREMVEMDIAARNISSVISMGYRVTLTRNLRYLTKLQTLQNHRYKESMGSAIVKMKKQKVYIHFEKIQLEAENLLQYLRHDPQDRWERVHSSYARILDQCRYCHEKTLP